MSGFVIRRVAQAVVVVVLISILVFGLIQLLPGGPAQAFLGADATPELVEAFNREQGFDRPLPLQYVRYVGNVATGDLGFSYTFNQPVTSLLAERLPKTLLLIGIATVVALLIAIPLGVLQGVRRNRPIDVALTGVSFVLYSMPSFWLALLLVAVFAIAWPILPSQAPDGDFAAVISNPAGLVLPVVTIAVVIVPHYSRYMRSAMLDNLAEDYVRTAKAKGVSEPGIVLRHMLRNTLLPIVTLFGLRLPFALSGGLIVETVFNYPGMGLLFWNASLTQDYPILLGVTLLIAVVVVLGSLVADILYAALDPRIRLVTR